MQTFQEESWGETIGEMLPFFKAHWEEAEGRDGIPLSIDHRAYRVLEESGGLLLLTARVDGKLEGYWSMVLSPMLHSSTLRAAQTDLLFLSPAGRAGGTFRKFLAFAEGKLVSRAVKLWFLGGKKNNMLGHLLSRHGFQLDELTYLKRLGA